MCPPSSRPVIPLTASGTAAGDDGSPAGAPLRDVRRVKTTATVEIRFIGVPGVEDEAERRQPARSVTKVGGRSTIVSGPDCGT